MLQRISGAMVLVALTGCTQEDQKLPFEFESTAPVVRTVGSGATVVSTPAGISLSLPAGAVPAGSEIMLAKLDGKARLSGGSAPVGDLFLVAFEETPQRDPSIEFSFALNRNVTAGDLVALTPVVFRVEAPGQQPSANLIPAGRGTSQASSAAGYMRADSVFELLMRKRGSFQGVMTGGTISEMGHRTETVAEMIRNAATASVQHEILTATPPFEESAFYPWDDQSFDWAIYLAANSNPSAGGNGGPGLGEWTLSGFQVQDIDPETREAILSHFGFENPAARFYVFGTLIPSYVLLSGLPSGEGKDPSYPLLPSGASSATFELTCVGMKVPGADDLPLCDGEVIDVRAGRELLNRFPASVVVPLYLFGEVTLQSGGAATGSLAYGLGLRTALASNFTGLELEDELDLAGTWSASGATLTVGGQWFQYFTPDAQSLVIAVSDSVRIEDKGGADSWQPIRAYLKLKRR
jgi:hypothetical protein